MKKIAILTAGGDAPGMNAAIRAIVRTASYYNIEVYGVEYAFKGLYEGSFKKLECTDVSNIIQRGGTILKTRRFPDFSNYEIRKSAYNQLKQYEIDAFIGLGGDGTMKGAYSLQQETNIKVMGIPCTIDNDVFGTDETIGFDTAVNTAVDAIDKIRDTAESHDRLFFVEVMGRTTGFIGLAAGIAGGAEAILIPEDHGELSWLIDKLKMGWSRTKHSNIVVVAEGDDEGNAQIVAQKVKSQIPDLEYRIAILGHIQRGGKPTARDRIIATKIGNASVTALLNGKTGLMCGIINDEIAFTPLNETFNVQKHVDAKWNEMNRIVTS